MHLEVVENSPRLDSVLIARSGVGMKKLKLQSSGSKIM